MEKTIENTKNYEIYSKRNKIIQQSKGLSVFLQIIFYICVLLSLVFFLLSVGMLAGMLDDDFSIKVIKHLTEFIMPVRGLSFFVSGNDVYIINCIIAALILGIISIQIYYLHKTVNEWAKGSSPFNIRYVKNIRHLSVSMCVFLLFVQPLLTLFGIGLFAFSYLMEYGTVLEENFKNTIHSHEQMIMSLAEIIEAKSGQTGLHVKRVSEYSKILAEGVGLNGYEVEEIRIASMLHDVGKLLIPSEILEKPGKLTDEEFKEIKKHTQYGRNLLENTSGSVLEKAQFIAYEHHEKWDGTGYSNIIGEDITLEARIVAVADVFDALVSKRSYKDSWSVEDAKAEILRSAGSHFDPKMVEVFINQYDKLLEVKEKYKDED